MTQEQLDAYKRVHEDDVKDTLARLTKVMSSQDLPDVDPPATFTKERCLKYMKQMHKLQEEVLEETRLRLQSSALPQRGDPAGVMHHHRRLVCVRLACPSVRAADRAGPEENLQPE